MLLISAVCSSQCKGTSVEVVGSTIFGTADSTCLAAVYVIAGTQYPVTDDIDEAAGPDPDSVTYFQSPTLENGTYELVIDIVEANSSCPYVLDFISYTVPTEDPMPSASTVLSTDTIASYASLSTLSSASSPSAPPSTSAEQGMNHHFGGHHSNNSKVIVAVLAGILGGLAAILLGLAIFFFVRRRRKRARDALRPEPFSGGLHAETSQPHFRGPHLSRPDMQAFAPIAAINSPDTLQIHSLSAQPGFSKNSSGRNPPRQPSQYTTPTVSGVNDILGVSESGSQTDSRWRGTTTAESPRDTHTEPPLPTASTPNLLRQYIDSGVRYSGDAPSDVTIMDVPPMYSPA